MQRIVSLSRSGRHVAVGSRSAIELVDALGTSPLIRLTEAQDFACIGSELWLLAGARVQRHTLANGNASAPIALPAEGRVLTAGATTAIVDAAMLIDGTTCLAITHPATRAFPIDGRRIAAVTEGELAIVDVGSRAVATARLAGEIVDVRALFGGRLLAVLARCADEHVWTVLREATRIHELRLPASTSWSVAADAGAAIATDMDHFAWIDLRRGVVTSDGPTPFAVEGVDVSSDGRYAVFAARDEDEPRVAHLATVTLRAAMQVVPEVDPAILSEQTAPDPEPEPERPQPPIDVARVRPRAFGEPLPPLAAIPSPDWPPYGSAREHVEDLFDLVEARLQRAITIAWSRGRVAAQERELRAVLGSLSETTLRDVDARLAAIAERTTGRLRSTLAVGKRLPFVDLMRELDLSAMAGQVLGIVLAAAERAEVARLVEILSGRRTIDRFLLETVLAGEDRAKRVAIGREVAATAALRRNSVLHVAGEPVSCAYEAITVDGVVVERVLAEAPSAPTVRPLEQLCIADAALRAIVDVVSHPVPALRLVLRGRRGSGRRAVVAALAARVGRPIGEIDCARLPRAGAAMASALQLELRRVVLRGGIPVISGLELADPADLEGRDRLRQVIGMHPGPIVIRTAPESSLAIDPGFDTVTLPSLSETERAAFWCAALVRAKITAAVDALAARWRIGPGVIESIIARCAGDASQLDELARQHVANRLAHVATPVRRLPLWEQVALPDDVVDSIRELIGRVSHRRTVLEGWGFDAKLTSARGLTVLFYGPPGTGKSMVAGLIARELGLELYRVDLSRVVSKWIGETEKNLGEVFDAAEDGQVVILFDEADSLFAKRTEVKSSHDRYANLEVNYLLQRLDSFEGIAILTTNLDGSIDPAFKRRMSMRLQFPFPDEDMRKRLWASHIPAQTPTANDFNFDELGRRFPLSGGYIRNCALRAGYLAAQERRPLAHDHLLRAITLEYRELGKLATDGRLE